MDNGISNKKYLALIDNYDAHCHAIIKSATVDTSESKEAQRKRMKKLEADYILWFEYYFPKYAKKKSAAFHKKLANKIIGKRKIRMLAEIYRGGAKSVHIDLGIPLYLMFVKKELNFMFLIGETFPKAKKLISSIQAELEVNPRLAQDYGKKQRIGDWSDGDFITSDGIRFMAIGFGMSPRGAREGANRPDYIVVDDVDNKAHFNNDRLMSGSVDYISEDIEGCFDNDSDDDAIERFVYANNNMHKKSITNRLKKEFLQSIKQDIEDNGYTDYEVLTITAVKDLVTFTPNWPEKTSADYWRRKYRRKPRSFLREYQHTHVEDGKVFKAEYMQWKEMLPLHKYDALIIYGDLSYKENADYKAMILMGKTGRELHCIQAFCRQTSRTEVAQWTYDLWEDRNLGNLNVPTKIEGLFAMDEFTNDFDTEGDERNYYIPVIADKKNKENKFTRIESMEGFFIKRRVFFNEKEKTNTDQVTLIDQLLGFEKGSQMNDDGPDCMQSCIAELNTATHINKFEPRITKRTHSKKRY